ncbi:PepSY-associated TM helix domain-containing protein [Aegicerativicinus sediminis]
MKKNYTFRKLINDIHLWLGIGSGIVLFLVCLSGTILTFEKEIKSAFTENLEVEGNSESILSAEQLVQKLSGKGTIDGFTIPSNSTSPYEFRVKMSPEDRRGTAVYVNQFTGETLQHETNDSINEFFMTMFRLHRWLLLDTSVGRPIVGIATIIFFFLSISGIILWFPKKMLWKQFKPGFKIKFSASWKRINHDLHNTLGFYSCIFLIVMTLTGLNWSFGWYKEGASAVLGTPVFNRSQPEITVPESNASDLGLSEILNIANKEFNYSGDLIIGLPSDRNDYFSIRKKNASSWTPTVSNVLILSKQGDILMKDIFNEKPLNVQIASLIKPLHTGEIFGGISKIIYFLACLIATSLPITGIIIWINKLKKKRAKKRSKQIKKVIKLYS